MIYKRWLIWLLCFLLLLALRACTVSGKVEIIVVVPTLVLPGSSPPLISGPSLPAPPATSLLSGL